MCGMNTYTTVASPRKVRIVAEFAAVGHIAIDEASEHFYILRPGGELVPDEFATIGDAIVRCLNNGGWGEHTVTLV